MLLRLAAAFCLLCPAGPAAPPPGVAISAGAQPPVLLSAAQIAQLPQVPLSVAFVTAHGPFSASFAGPLLWNLLINAHAIDPAQPKMFARAFIAVTGADGYVAVIALGEIAPSLEGKPVILADAMNGKKLAPGDLRIIIPGEHHGARDVRNVVRIALLTQ
jgi:hypothetical protein